MKEGYYGNVNFLSKFFTSSFYQSYFVKPAIFITDAYNIEYVRPLSNNIYDFLYTTEA